MTTSTDISRTAHRCLKYVNRYGDGLSVDHLAALLPKTPRFSLNIALAQLVQQDQVIHAQNGWYYPIEEPKTFEPLIVKPQIQEPMMSIPLQHKSTSTITKIREWFEKRDHSSAPIEMPELVELCGNVRRDSVTKALKFLLDEYKLENPEKYEQLDAAIIRRKYFPKIEIEKEETVMEEKAEEISMEELEKFFPSEFIPHEHEEDNWVTELRNRLLAKRIPEHATEWKETLQQIDNVFAEMGVPETQRARKHIQEIIEWLSV